MIRKKTINTIAPLLADSFLELDRTIFNDDKYWDYIKKNSKRIGAFKNYLICKLCESSVISITRETDSLSIKLNDFSTYIFADAIIDRFELPVDSGDIVFPLTIEMTGNLKVEYYTVDECGTLFETEPLELNELFGEQITQIDKERIEIVFHFWKSNLNEGRPGQAIILIVSANCLTLLEEQDLAWTKIFDTRLYPYYQYFKKQYASNRYISDHAECEKVIEEYEKGKERKLINPHFKNHLHQEHVQIFNDDISKSIVENEELWIYGNTKT
jgi:hypothetical protein